MSKENKISVFYEASAPKIEIPWDKHHIYWCRTEFLRSVAEELNCLLLITHSVIFYSFLLILQSTFIIVGLLDSLCATIGPYRVGFDLGDCKSRLFISSIRDGHNFELPTHNW